MDVHDIIEYAVIVEDLTVAYDVKPVLWDVDLKIPKGRLMAIVGPNGAGKTTLIKAMIDLIKPVTGRIRFPSSDTTLMPDTKKRIGYVPQSNSVDWDFPTTVLDVVIMGRYGILGWLKRPGKQDVEIAMQTLKKVGMEEFSSRQISQLSGGQQQRVFLARALIQEADIYFMDEPFKGVDTKTEKAILLLLRELKEQGKTVVVVHHDLQTVSDYFDWVTLINIRIIASGPVNKTFNNENLKKTYQSSSTLMKGVI
jgi:manganese/zinc/iron transport system ATP- binding protein